MLLEAFLTTIPTPDARPVKVRGGELGFRPGCQVTIPFGGSRLCSGIVLDMHEPIVKSLFELDGDGNYVRDKALELGLAVYYWKRKIFHGPLHAPEFDYETGKVTLTAKDPTLRLSLCFVKAGDATIDPGVTLDGEGILTILDTAQNTDAENTAGDPVLGIVRGIDTTTDSATIRKLTEGDQIYQSITDMRDLVDGPDINVVPIETDPAELASGSDFVNYFAGAAAIADNGVTDFELPIGFPGLIGGLKLGVWITHTEPGEVDVDLIHPDGTTIRIYTGLKETTAGSGSGDFLGQGTGADLCNFEAGHSKPYGSAYPHLGTFRPDHSLNGFLDKPAAGTWKLRVIDGGVGHTGTVNQFQLAFELPAPGYCRMDVSDKPDSEALPAPTCTFEKGHGRDNARVLRVKPQGDLTRNYFTARSNAAKRTRKSDASIHSYGRYEGDEAGGQSDSTDVLAAFAGNEVLAYSRPLPVLELAPKDDGGQDGVLRYGRNFVEGGYVLAVGKKGYAFHKLLARVMQVQLTNVVDAQGSGAVTCDMDVIPAIALSSEIADA